MTVRVFAQQETTTTPTSQEPVGAHAVPPSSDEQTVRVTTCIRGDMPVDQQPRSSCSLAEQHAARVGIDAGRLRRAQVEAKLPSGAGNTPPLMEPAAPASPPWTLPKAATGNTPSLVEPAAPPAGQSGLAVQAGRTHAKVTAKNSTKENASKLAARAGRARAATVTNGVASTGALAHVEQGPGGGSAALSWPTRAEWRLRALELAGIDPTEWNPQKGFAANRESVERVYKFYERLYREHAELRWAGMAKLAGGVVWGALERVNLGKMGAFGISISSISTPPLSTGAALGAALAVDELAFLERKLLVMQKQIFDDLAWQHMAYVEGGLSALEEAYKRGEISSDNLGAWRDIASGDEERIWRGNIWLLFREQKRILQIHYDEIRNRPLSGTVMGRAMSWLAESPVPGGRPFSSAVEGDLTLFEDRWRWIEREVIEPYRHLSPEYRARLNAQPLAELAARRFACRPSEPCPQPRPTPPRLR